MINEGQPASRHHASTPRFGDLRIGEVGSQAPARGTAHVQVWGNTKAMWDASKNTNADSDDLNNRGITSLQVRKFGVLR